MVSQRTRNKRWRWAAVALALAVVAVFGAAWFFPPDTARLHEQSRIVLGREGEPIAVFEDQRGEWKLPTTAAQVDPLLTRMLIASEDRYYYAAPGVNPLSILRATVQMLVAGHVVSGASTLTMQVVRLLHPAPRTLPVKITEAFRAIALNEHADKTRILGMWLSLAPFGGNIVGVEAASRLWFGHGPATLSPAEAALLVALCRRPASLDPSTHPRAAMAARNRILREAASRGIISSPARDYAEATPVPRLRHTLPLLSPQVASRLPDHARTTIDGQLDAAVATFARGQLRLLAPGESLAIVVADARSRAIRAIYAGDWANPRRAGFLDLTRVVRSPGSALKPFLYGLAFADGLARPNTLLADVPHDFGGYAPDDYTGRFMGEVTATTALRRSLNLPAVSLMQRLGPGKFTSALASSGIPLTLPRNAEPTLPLALGGAGISLRHLVALYAALATDGTVEPLHLIAGERRPRHLLFAEPIARAVTDILVRPFPGGGPPGIAWKTGTSAGNRDNWAIGYSRNDVVGVWIGQPNGGALPNSSALSALPVLAGVFGLLNPAPITTEPALAPVSLAADTGAKLALLFPPPKASLPADLPVHLRAMGGVRPLTFIIDGRVLPSVPALRSAAWQPAGPGFYRLVILDAEGNAVTDLITVGTAPRTSRETTAHVRPDLPRR